MARSALGAVAAATLIGFAGVPEGIPAALSALVAAINVAHPRGDHWRCCRRAAEALRRERELLLGHFGSYAARANATALCIQACALALWQVEPGPLPIG